MDESRRLAPSFRGIRGWAVRIAAVAALLAVAAQAQAGAAGAPTARIVEVAVFPDRAEVVREARVDLPAGLSTIDFPGLPWLVEPDSLRVTAKGVPAILGAVEFADRADEPKETPELAAAREELRRLEGEMAQIDAEEQTEKELREFLGALRATAARESEKIGEGKADPNSIQAVYGLLRSNLMDLSRDSIARGERRARLKKDLEVARAKVAAAGPAGAVRTKTAVVEVEVKQAGALTLRLAYVAPNASWRPAYRASLDAATGAIGLVSEAVITQRSGEAWSGVALRLSTAAPARGVEPPEISSLLLRPAELMARAKVLGGYAKIAAAPSPAALDTESLKEVSEIESADSDGNGQPDRQATSIEAGIVHSAYNVGFEVPGRSDVPSDGRDHRVGLRQETLEGSVGYRAVPALNAAAFLVVRTKAPAAYPLLRGPVRVFAGGAYLGSFPMQETAPGSELTLPFGIDNRIAVERTPLPRSREQSGVFGRERKIVFGFRTTIENLQDQKVPMTVEDRIPVSEDERITVEMGPGTTPGSKEVRDRPGILEWSFDLAPREKREIVLEYTVRHPKDLYVPGLD